MGIDEASKLFVAGLPDAMDEASLRDLFTNTGSEVQELTMPRDRATGRPRGFAFVRLGSPEQAEAARGSLDGTLIEGRAISVRPFSSEPPARGERRPGAGPGGPGGGMGGPRPDTSDRTLYVGNLPYDVTEDEVRELFTGNGGKEPQRIHLPVDPEGRRRGFGFVTFDTAEDANEAIVAVREGAVRGRRCVVNIAHPRGERPVRPGGGGGAPFERRSFGGDGGGGGPPPDMGGGGGGRGAGPRKAFGADAVAGATRGDKDRRRRRFEEGAGGGGGRGGAGGGGKKKRGDDWGDDY